MTTDYKTILKEAGYPTDVLCLDFETYFDTEYSLSKMSTIEYINDPRFELTGLGVGLIAFGRTDNKFWSPEFLESKTLGDLEIIYGDGTLEGCTVLVKHARFDITILQEKFDIIPKYIIDLEDLTRHYDSRMSHKLKDLAKLHKLKPKGDTQDFKGLDWVSMTLVQRKALAEYTITDIEDEIALFKIYLPKLTNPKIELQLARHTLDLWLHKRFVVDIDLASKTKVKMRGKIASAIAASGHTPKELRSKKFVEWLQEALPAGEDVPMKQGKRGNIPALAKKDKACQQLMVHPEKKVRDLIEGRMGAKEWNSHIKKIGNIVSQSIANGGLLRVPLNYYGCHTGRPSGAEKYNILNFTKRDRDGIVTDPLKKETRKILRAPDGHSFSRADSCQIEARLAFWQAGQQDMLNKFADGTDLYSEYASKLFHEPVHKPRDDDPPDVYARMDLMRNDIGKVNMLGDQYGLGATRFYNNCLSNPILRPLFDDGTYDFKFCKRAIDLYRKDCYKVVQYWDQLEKAFRKVIRFPHLEVKVGPTTFRNQDGTVKIELPSGRVLYYRHCKISRKNSIKWHHGTLWGGSILENITQAMGHCLLTFWILKCEEAGIPVQMHIYDDITTLLPKDQAEGMLAKQMEIMRSLPEWASGLPVDVEGKLSETL